MPRERAVEAAGDGESGKASGCALAACIITGPGLDLAGQCPSLKGSGEARSPSEASRFYAPALQAGKCFAARRCLRI
jgi:hypothetical protein